MGFFDYDYCFCGNANECPKKDTCRRGLHVPGIHSYAEFYKENEECKYYWKKEVAKKENINDHPTGADRSITQ